MYVLIDQVVLDQDVDQTVDQGKVRSRLERQMEIREHRGLRDPRIDDDERLVAVGLQPLPQDRMVVGDVGANQDDDVGAFEVLVRARRTVAAERPLVAGHRGGHAQRRVAVVVARAESELHELAERVELFGDELSGADHADGLGTVAACTSRNLRPSCDRFVPAHTLEPPIPARAAGAVREGDVQRLVLGQPFWAERPPVDRMIRIAAHADGAAVLDADEHPAARPSSTRRSSAPSGRESCSDAV